MEPRTPIVMILTMVLSLASHTRAATEIMTTETKISMLMDLLNPTEPYDSVITGSNTSVSDVCGMLLMLKNVTQIIYPDSNMTYCDRVWDGVMCWPLTPAPATVTQPCPSYLKYVRASNNATKECLSNGTWLNFTDYRSCVYPHRKHQPDNTVPIYITGYTISTAALVVAMAIFLYFRSLRCIRNVIHCHLFFSFVLMNVCFLSLTIILSYHGDNLDDPKLTLHDALYHICKTLLVAFKYFQMTNFFWMFVEGLYLHTIVVWAYSADKLKFWHYCIIGWGIPVAFVISWIITKMKLDDDNR